MRLAALWHTGSSWPRDHICVPYIGRWIPNHYTTREVPQKHPCAPLVPHVRYQSSTKLLEALYNFFPLKQQWQPRASFCIIEARRER